MSHAFKNARHRKKQGNIVHNKQVNRLIKTYEQLTQMSKLGEEDIKVLIITIFHIFKKLVETWKIQKKPKCNF